MPAPSYTITTVVTPATQSDLTSLKVWKLDFGVTTRDKDQFITRTITRCSAMLQNYLNRTLAKATYKDTIHTAHRFHGHDPLQLGRWPLVSITSLTEDGTALVENTDYRADYTTGQLYRMDGNGSDRGWPALDVVVQYVAGYDLPSDAGSPVSTLPSDIQEVLGRMVYARYAEQNRDPMVSKESVVGIGSIEYATPTMGDSELLASLDGRYRVPAV